MARNEAEETRATHRQASLDALHHADKAEDYDGAEARYWFAVAQVEATLALSADVVQ